MKEAERRGHHGRRSCCCSSSLSCHVIARLQLSGVGAGEEGVCKYAGSSAAETVFDGGNPMFGFELEKKGFACMVAIKKR